MENIIIFLISKLSIFSVNKNQFKEKYMKTGNLIVKEEESIEWSSLTHTESELSTKCDTSNFILGGNTLQCLPYWL